MNMKKLILSLFIVTKLNATTIVMHIMTPSNAPSSKTVARFELKNYGNNLPRVIGSYIIVSSVVEFSPDGAGLITGTVIGNDTISPLNTYYTISFFNNGVRFYSCDVLISGSSQNLDATTCLNPSTTPPVPFDSCVQCAGHSTTCPMNQFMIGLDISENAVCLTPPYPVPSIYNLIVSNTSYATSLSAGDTVNFGNTPAPETNSIRIRFQTSKV